MSGEWDYEKLAREMPAHVFLTWERFWSEEPWGWEHERDMAGLICATIVNTNPWRGKNAKTFQARDFIPRPPRPKAAKPVSQTAEIARAALAIAVAGGEIYRDGQTISGAELALSMVK